MGKGHCLRLVVVVLITTASLLQAQTTEEEAQTWGRLDDQSQFHWSNGKAWKLLDHQSKLTLVEGIEQGMMLMAREVGRDATSSDRAATKKQLDNLTIRGFRMSDIAEQIDAFYRDSVNLRIPIVDAYKYAMKKMHGAKQRELEDYAAELRLLYNR